MWSKTTTQRGKCHRLAAWAKLSEHLEEPQKCLRYKVCDPTGKKIGRVAGFSINEYGEPEGVRVRVGFFKLRCVLIPTMSIEVDEQRRIVSLQ